MGLKSAEGFSMSHVLVSLSQAGATMPQLETSETSQWNSNGLEILNAEC